MESEDLICGYQSHPAAAAFPLLEGDDFKRFVADMKANGLHEPIVLYKGQILDGRNRGRACDDGGIEPRFREYEGDDPVGYVVSLNMSRRHMNESQRAMVAARLAGITHGGDRSSRKFAACPALSQAERAEMLNVSERSVATATTVIAKAQPEVIQAVDRGELAVSAAIDLAKLEPARQREVIAELDKPDPPRVRDIIRRDTPVRHLTAAIDLTDDEGRWVKAAMFACAGSKHEDVRKGGEVFKRLIPAAVLK